MQNDVLHSEQPVHLKKCFFDVDDECKSCPAITACPKLETMNGHRRL